MKNFDLSIVVIGKNQGYRLLKIYKSLSYILSKVTTETIYVDSHSLDNSVEIAQSIFDIVVDLESSPNLSASAGRYTGTLLSSGKWILFLDGDMLLNYDFASDIVEHILNSDVKYGLIGNNLDIFDATTSAVFKYPTDKYSYALRHGGAVILSHDSLCQENWNPALFAYEELDLFLRQQSRGYSVKHIDKIFVHHFTEKITLLDKVLGNFIKKNSYLGNKYYGFGQLIAAKFQDKTLLQIIKKLPHLFIEWILLVITIMCITVGYYRISILFLTICFTYISVVKSPRYFVIYLAMLIQGIVGFKKYKSKWFPKITTITRKSNYRKEISSCAE